MRIRKVIFNLKRFLRTVSVRLLQLLGIFVFTLSLLAALIVVYDMGFPVSEVFTRFLNVFIPAAMYGLAGAYILRFLLLIRHNLSMLARISELLIITAATAVLVAHHYEWYQSTHPVLAFLDGKKTAYLIFTFIFIIEFSRNILVFYTIRSNPYKIFIFSYIALIITGTGLLMLPNATVSELSVTDALFTSTSAVCVTGLTTVDAATTFSETGMLILMLLMQLGGVGVMTFTSFFVFFTDNTFSYQNRMFIGQVVNDNRSGHVVKTVAKIILFTIIAETIGAVLIYMSIDNSPFFISAPDKVFYAVFHSVSAFCNAGFSSHTDGLYHISTRFNYNLHLVISVLIIIGGLGFPIVFNYYKVAKFQINNYIRHLRKKENIHHFPRLVNVNTRIVIYTTAILLVFGFLTFFISEYNHALKDLSWYGKVVTALFGSVTPRTAGFNTVNMTTLAFPTIMICMLLMWIGASPNSTGGGIKTSAFALAILNIISLGRGKDRIEISKRRIADESIRNAFAVIILSILVIGVCVFTITLIENQKPLMAIIFECISAFSTVGLSLGLTPELSGASKLVLVGAMFIGRVGTLTFFLAFVKKINTLKYNYPNESIII